MRTPKLRKAGGTLCWGIALMLAGCQQAPLPSSAGTGVAEAGEGMDEAHWAAEADLGKHAEILLRGDLALNGREQLFVINRFPFPKRVAGEEQDPNASPVFITRGAILEKNGTKWSEVLRCDEHVKNPSGYLGGVPADPIAGWRVNFNLDSKQGLELNFSPAAVYIAGGARLDQQVRVKNTNFDVRWNKNSKRYQAYDQSHERYLGEVPSLETPQSILKK